MKLDCSRIHSGLRLARLRTWYGPLRLAQRLRGTVVMDLKQNDGHYGRDRIAAILLNAIVENLSRLHKTRAFISAWVCKQHKRILAHFREKKGNRELMETLGMLETRAPRLCNSTKVTLQGGPGRLAQELCQSPSHTLPLGAQAPPDTGQHCGHCCSVAPRTWSHSSDLPRQRRSSRSLLPCLSRSLVGGQSRRLRWNQGHMPTRWLQGELGKWVWGFRASVMTDVCTSYQNP